MSRHRRLTSAARLRLETLEQRTLFSAGDLDHSFGVGGRMTADFFAGSDSAGAVALQPDGKIVAVGMTTSGGGKDNFAVARTGPNGNLDLGFSNDGLVVTNFAQGDDAASDVAIQDDGKIVVVGWAENPTSDVDFALARYNADGTLDLSFGTNGRVMTDFGGSDDMAHGVAIQADGKIVVIGSIVGQAPALGLARYNADGSLDSTFGASGLVTSSFIPGATLVAGNGIALQADGKIVAVGTVNKFIVAARYLPNGDLDSSFAGTGVIVADFSAMKPFVFLGAAGNSVAIQDDGRIVLAGS